MSSNTATQKSGSERTRRPIVCYFCQGNHHVKLCEARRLENTVCFACKKLGHMKKDCPVLAAKNKKKEEDFPVFLKTAATTARIDPSNSKNEWATIVKINRVPGMVTAVAKANEDAERLKNEQKQKKQEEYLARCEVRKKREEEEKTAYVLEMTERFGTRWFHFVKKYKDGEYNNDIAAEYRRKWEEEQEERYQIEYFNYRKAIEEIEQARERKREKKREREEKYNNGTMTSQEFYEWEKELEEEEPEDEDENEDEAKDAALLEYEIDCWESESFCKIGYNDEADIIPPEYIHHYHSTCEMLDCRAKVLENRKLMEEWLTEKNTLTKINK